MSEEDAYAKDLADFLLRYDEVQGLEALADTVVSIMGLQIAAITDPSVAAEFAQQRVYEIARKNGATSGEPPKLPTSSQNVSARKSQVYVGRKVPGRRREEWRVPVAGRLRRSMGWVL